LTIAAPEGAVFEKLTDVRRERAPYQEIAKRIIATVLESYPPVGGGPVVEIGAGDGQLRELLPDDITARIVHTEPTVRGVTELGRRYPGARIERAPVERLPFTDGEVSAVLGLCVLDLVPDLRRAVRELARVLAPGAPVVHFLDLSPFLRTVFERLVPLGLVPMPNVFDDPCANHWPEDLFFLEATRLGRILEVLKRQGHPLATPLAQYARLFQNGAFDVEQAIVELDQLAASEPLRRSLRDVFRDAYRNASPAEREQLGEFRGHAVSSSRELATRLLGHFSADPSFRVEVADILAASDTVPASGPIHYESLTVGEHRRLPEAPPVTLVERVLSPEPYELVREHGILCFVATRTTD
jgi:ubiquinone/menaquinone biosynthesis C-methylase UbiE